MANVHTWLSKFTQYFNRGSKEQLVQHASDDLTKNSRKFGSFAEDFVAQYLEQHGYTILQKNYKKFYGEIDIIAQHDETVCFVEVKARHNPYVSMHEIITPAKQKKIIMVAQDYISRHGTKQTVVYRFDVAFVCTQNSNYAIQYLPNAFTMTEY